MEYILVGKRRVIYLVFQVTAEWLNRREEYSSRCGIYGISLYEIENTVGVLLAVVAVQPVEPKQL
jgi:hypothetical protein